MRERYQIDRGDRRFDFNISATAHRFHQTVYDRLSGSVTHVQDTAARMSSFLTPYRTALAVSIELDAGRFFQNLVQQWWTFFSENACRIRRACSGAGCDYV
jgi:hypothetical protein